MLRNTFPSALVHIPTPTSATAPSGKTQATNLVLTGCSTSATAAKLNPIEPHVLKSAWQEQKQVAPVCVTGRSLFYVKPSQLLSLLCHFQVGVVLIRLYNLLDRIYMAVMLDLPVQDLAPVRAKDACVAPAMSEISSDQKLIKRNLHEWSQTSHPTPHFLLAMHQTCAKPCSRIQCAERGVV